MKYNYPITNELVNTLKKEYREEAIGKGNSWSEDFMIDGVPATEWLTTVKLNEEYEEIQELIARYYNFSLIPKSFLKQELIDLILVACMIYERLNKA